MRRAKTSRWPLGVLLGVALPAVGGCVLVPLPFAKPGTNTSPLIGAVGPAESNKPIRPGVTRSAVRLHAGLPYAIDDADTWEYHVYSEQYGWMIGHTLIAPCHGPQAIDHSLSVRERYVLIGYDAGDVARSVEELDRDGLHDAEKRLEAQGVKLETYADRESRRRGEAGATTRPAVAETVTRDDPPPARDSTRLAE